MPRNITTDAIITEHDAVTGQPHPADPLDMATDQEAAYVRDGFGLFGVIQSVHVDARSKEWFKQDSKGLKPWMVEFKDKSNLRVSYMLNTLQTQPGNKWVDNGVGGVNFESSSIVPPAPVSGGGGGDFGGGRAADDPIMDKLREIEKKVDKILDEVN